MTEVSESSPTVSVESAPSGEMGQKYLAAGERVSLRLWQDEPPGEPKPEVARDYETVGYVISGRARLRVGEDSVDLEPGSSWVVPQGAVHTYEILETLTALEATSPPAQGRDGDPRA